MRRLIIDGALEENCYFIIRDNLCFIVDPGYEKERIQQFVKDNDLNVIGILLTHGHFDHFGAIDCFDAPVYMNELDKPNFKYHYDYVFDKYKIPCNFKIEEINFKYIKNGDVITIGNDKITVIETPGHTVGSVCYKIGNELYSGDTLFKETVGRWDLQSGNKEELKETIKQLLAEFDDELKVLPGHGNATTIGHEKQENSFYIYEC